MREQAFSKRFVEFARGPRIAKANAMSASLKLSVGRTVLDVADASRFAFEQFLDLDPHDKLTLTSWLVGPYRRAMADVPRRTRTLGHGEVEPYELSTIVSDAQTLLAQAIDAAGKPGAEPLLAMLPATGIEVIPVVDSYGAHGFAPMDVGHTKLGARVLSLLVADYLTRPEDYFAAPEIESTRRRSSFRMRAVG